MSTRWRQKVSSALAISAVLALLLLLILLWTAVRNGSFSENRTPINNRVRGDKPTSDETNVDGSSPYGTDDSVRLKPPLTFVTTTSTTTKSPTEMRHHLTSQSKQEFVRPTKLPKPMHTVDIITEMHRKDAEGDNSPIVVKVVPTGNYRKSSNRVWDADPEYVISAFGLHLDLQLSQNSKFISKSIRITHVSHNNPNETRIHHETGDTVSLLPGCFYTGTVKGDAQSMVTVSLCDGMRGHIYTSYGSFFIEPVEAFTDDNPNVLHEIRQMATQVAAANPSSLPSSAAASDTAAAAADSATGSAPTLSVADDDDDVPEETTSSVIVAATNSSSCGLNDVDSDTTSASRRRKRSVKLAAPQPSNAYTMKVLVGVDAKMQAYHRENGYDLKEYILTLMSIVSTVYSDPSIGNAIDIAVVDIMHVGTIVNPPAHGPSTGVSASDMLSQFCRFVQRNSRRQHDVALLLSREQICRNEYSTKCDTLGLAEMGTMCRPSSCAIVQDNGLAAAFTIAHELGHVLNIPHDDDAKCNRYKKFGVQQENIMSRMLDKNVHPWSWSDCSRHYVTEFLENNHGLCMLNLPERDIVEEPRLANKLAGEKFTADTQCRLINGPDSTVCAYMSICERLWCGNESEGCLTLQMPWADGTPCESSYSTDEHWCQRGKCVQRNPSALVKVDGGWGPWSRYSECSRTCGGGVQSSKRDCNNPTPNNGGKYCVGQRIRYESCNVQDCSAEDGDFREKQCAAMNGNTFDIPGISPNVRWVPKYAVYPTDECKLLCRVANSNSYFQLEDKVIDGTACSQDTFNKCVNGVCRPAACDNRLNSKSTLDKCGVCGGTNESCTDVIEIFNQTRLLEMKRRPTSAAFYYDACFIPKGASNIEIIQMGFLDDLNYIALLDENGTYILNGNNVILQYPKTFPYGGVTFTYTGTNATTERINSSYTRKLKRDLRVQIMSRTDHYPYDEMLTCMYTRPLDTRVNRMNSFYSYNEVADARVAAVPTVPPTIYKWQIGTWSKCTRICNGTSVRTVDCILTDQNEDRIVAPAYCSSPKPRSEDACNTHCNFYWKNIECPRDCEAAREAFQLHCIMEMNGERGTEKNNIYCSHLPKPKECTSPCVVYSDWSECCGGEVEQRRSAHCINPTTGHRLNERHCKPVEQDWLTRRCVIQDCPYAWVFDESAECSVTCGEGFLIRPYYCVQNHGLVNEEKCAHLDAPAKEPHRCSRPACETPKVIHNNYYTNYRRHYNDYPTSAALARPSTPATTTTTTTTPSTTTTTTTPKTTTNVVPPSTTTTTTTTTTSTTTTTTSTTPVPVSYSWRSSMWAGCSVKCGMNGTRQRQVRCHSDQTSEQMPDRYCSSQQKPTDITPCDRMPPCPEWKIDEWQECADDCQRTRSVRCMIGSKEVIDDYCRQLNSPPERNESCCHYKWKLRWSPCSTTCGAGIRKRQPVCLRFHPKFANVQPPRKRGTIVSDEMCDISKIPPVKIREKRCNKPCLTPKWQSWPWSRCTNGCGKGLATRQVKCMYGRHAVKDSECSNTPKPTKLRQCDSKDDCEWRKDPWRTCSCAGTTKRRVSCYDRALQKPSSSCREDTKPPTRQKCLAPANCSCRTIQQRQNVRVNGDYVLNIQGHPVKIYCHDMNTVQPKEYISLKSRDNYAVYYDKQSKNKYTCPRSENETFVDPSLASGVSYFLKVRLDLHRLLVIDDDYQFVLWSGTRMQTFGSAGDCFSMDSSCLQGRFSINFEGTRFRIRSETSWDVSPNANIIFEKKLEPPYKKVSASCGGFCGSCFPNKQSGIRLELDHS